MQCMARYKFTCVCVCLCVRHTFCQVAYRSDPTPQQIFTIDSLEDADLRNNVPFGVSMMNNHIYVSKVPQKPRTLTSKQSKQPTPLPPL